MKPKKTREEVRKITFQELGALLGTRALLADKDIAFGNDYAKHKFDMSTQGGYRGCGTVGCIGGTMALLMNYDPHVYVGSGLGHGSHSRSLRKLFYPDTEYQFQWDRIKPTQAVKAINNWLETGNPKWKTIVKPRAKR